MDKLWTNQTAFDQVLTKLLEQGYQSVDANRDVCVYRSSCGYKCAIGWLIPDELYSEDLEGKSWENLPEDLRLKLGVGDLLAMELQNAHDHGFRDDNDAAFLKEMCRIAEKYNLDLPKHAS